MRRQSSYRLSSQQKGATLVIALVVLVLIMMIGITIVSTSSTQYKLAGNLQFEDAAMNNAEAAISTAENWLATGYADLSFTTAGYADAGTRKVYLLPSEVATNPFESSWWGTNSLSVSGDTQRYFIQQMSTNSVSAGSSAAVGSRGISVCNKVNTYLITGRGMSARGASKLVQSYYSVISC